MAIIVGMKPKDVYIFKFKFHLLVLFMIDEAVIAHN